MNDQSYFPMERNKYYYGKLLTVKDFESEQNYNQNKIRMDHRLLNGTGVICGLSVTQVDDNTLMIGNGAALDFSGNEIVIPENLVRKLPMLDGYDSLVGKHSAWLCLEYHEEDTELVKTMRAEDGKSNQYNKVREGSKLYLSAGTPDYVRLLESLGKRNVNILYNDQEVVIALCIPSAVRSGEEFAAELIVVKNKDIQHVSVSLKGISNIVECEDNTLEIAYTQSPENKENVLISKISMHARAASGITTELYPQGAVLEVEYDHRQYKNNIEVPTSITLCKDRHEYQEVLRHQEDIRSIVDPVNLPLYLAKIELINSKNQVFIESITELPFAQKLGGTERHDTAGGENIRVETNVRKLEYWQEPEVKADYYDKTGTIALDFGIPSPEVHDYKISHGVVDLELASGLRVNSRTISDEIPHGLGPGNVDIRLSVETESNGELYTLTGNSEVFKLKGFEKELPWVETAVISYPERGTMQIGVWLHDTVPGNRIRIHYYAQKPEYDTDRLLAETRASIEIIPEVSRLNRGEKQNMKAIVTGSADTSVIWSIRDTDGGAIDKNGLYQAPQIPGTYEIVATAGTDKNVKTSAFIIVE